MPANTESPSPRRKSGDDADTPSIQKSKHAQPTGFPFIRRRYILLPLNNMTPSQFLLAYDVRMSRMMRSANRMAAAAFAKR